MPISWRNEISTWPEEQRKVTYPACWWAIWPGPPAWAPGWPRAAQLATGRTGRHQPGRGHGVPSGGYVDSGWESRTSQTKTAGEKNTTNILYKTLASTDLDCLRKWHSIADATFWLLNLETGPSVLCLWSNTKTNQRETFASAKS